MSQEDEAAIVSTLVRFFGKPVTFVELGTFQDGWRPKLTELFGTNLDYYGIDNTVEPGSHTTTITADTLDAVDKVPARIDAVLIDACHCHKHVKLDFWLYGNKVRPGGLAIFHDTEPSRQRLDMGYGCSWGRTVGVRSALDELFPREGWRLACESSAIYGVAIYERF